MTLTEFLCEPYVNSTLAGITVYFISRVANKFGKKPKKRYLYSELDLALEGVHFDFDGLEVLMDFFGNEQVAGYFYKYITYRTMKMEGDTSFTRTFSQENFIDNIIKKIIEYGRTNYDYEFDEIELINYLNEILNKIKNRVIDKIKDEHQFLFHSLTNIELLLKDIKVLNSLMLSKSTSSYSEVDYTDYIKIIKKRYSKAHVYGIDSIDLDTFYVFPKLKLYEKKTVADDIVNETFVDWNDIFNLSNIISLIGGPGYGKTTFIKSMIQNYSELNIYGAKVLIPIYIDLKNYYDYKKNLSSYSIIKFLHDSMINDSGLSDDDLPIESLQLELDKGNCIILCDALDEVVKEERDKLQQKIITFFENVNPTNKIIISSRARGFTPYTKHIVEINSLDFNCAKQYVKKMTVYKKYNFPKSDSKSFLNQAKLLIDNGFLTSYLILSLLVNIYKSEQELPTTKYMIYKKCVDHIVLQRERKDKKTQYNFSNFNYILKQSSTFEELAMLGFPSNNNVDEERILITLANKYQSKYGNYANAYNASEEFIEFCKERTDFYVRGSKESTYKYFHRSFYDYYLAKRIVTKYPKPRELFAQISNLSKESEVFELLLEILMDVDYDRYLEFVQWVLDYVDNDFNCNSLIDNKTFEIVTLLFRDLSEVVFVEKYYSQVCKYILIKKNDLNYYFAVNIMHFLAKNNLKYKFISFLECQNNHKYYQTVLVYLLDIVYRSNKLSIYEYISYDFFDGYVHFNNCNYFDLNIIIKTIPEFEIIFDGMIKTNEKIKLYKKEFKILYDCLIEHHNKKTNSSLLVEKAKELIEIVV